MARNSARTFLGRKVVAVEAQYVKHWNFVSGTLQKINREGLEQVISITCFKTKYSLGARILLQGNMTLQEPFFFDADAVKENELRAGMRIDPSSFRIYEIQHDETGEVKQVCTGKPMLDEDDDEE